MVAIFICFLKIGYQIKTKKGTVETSMECQIVLTCNDLEKTVEQTLQQLLFLLCVHLLFCSGFTNGGFVVNGLLTESVP